jgi:hypothetical protein
VIAACHLRVYTYGEDSSQACVPEAPTVPGRHGFLLSTDNRRCVYARIDHWSIPGLLERYSVMNVDDLLGPEDIMGVELYRYDETPPEWRQNAFRAETVVTVKDEQGRWFEIGEIGFPRVLPPPPPPPSPVRRASRPPIKPGTVIPQGIVPPTCSFVQIWTRIAW